jgi:hypothetical protein
MLAAALVVFALEVHNATVYVSVVGLLTALMWGVARYLAYISTRDSLIPCLDGLTGCRWAAARARERT